MSRRVIFLAGAPDSSAIDWSQWLERNNDDTICLRIRRYLGIANRGDDNSLYTLTQATASRPIAKWRHVPLNEDAEFEKQPEATQFLSFNNASKGQSDQEHVQFLEYSLAALQNLDSSQIASEPLDYSTHDETTFVSDLSFNSDITTSLPTTASTSTNASDEHQQQIVNFAGYITDLKRVPTARHLDSIHPQTMTINILASVISIQTRRTVRLRKRAAEMDIVEVLVGDETRAGFNISFWLPPADSQRSNAPSRFEERFSLKAILDEMRIGDLLLISNIALGTFRSNVYGQSLSKRITRNNTSILKLSKDIVGLSAPSMAKLARVRDWSSNFVGNKTGTKRVASPDSTQFGHRKRNSLLPPDTQPGGH
ncbi:hypothetical protein CKM354_000844600 [Cercospora kikuchii]|uniref:Uncharacterized protein n=1 Tax=Cercospora kikuchii TaxID=84275 RepID=A0A9P3FFB9_9PEZI|nr:uncharacterized protein CKM354_000844600 [Cercospora kikuchii]GIZ45271.1 hypothetical protein CKM354_000844600 [Cercospora kikuchii]